MKIVNKRSIILFFAALALGLGSLLVAGKGEAFETGPHEEWVITPASQQKQAEGFCVSPSLVCRELCYFNRPTGDFYCFNN